MIKALVLALIVSVAFSHVSKLKSSNAMIPTLIMGIITFVSCYLEDILFGIKIDTHELFADQTLDQSADEAGLVFGDMTGTSGGSSSVYYSGLTMSIANDANMYAGQSINSDTFVTMTDLAKLTGVLNNLRIISIDVDQFDTLTPLKFSQSVFIIHNVDHEDRYICNTNGKATYNNAKPVGSDTSHIFQIINAVDPTDNSGIVSLQSPLLICSIGSQGGPNSYISVDTDGTLLCTATKDKATTFHIGNCLAACASETWRFM